LLVDAADATLVVEVEVEVEVVGVDKVVVAPHVALVLGHST